MELYPNPFESQLNIELAIPQKDIYQVKVFNVLGQVFFAESMGYNQGKITFSIATDKIPCENIIFVQVSDSQGNSIIKKATCIR